MRTKCLGRSILVSLIAFTAGCGPTLRFRGTPGVEPGPPRAPADVLILDRAPTCPSQTVGFFDGHSNLGSSADTLVEMQQIAADRGADAVLIFGGPTATHHGGHDITASLIVFIDPMCRH